MERNVVEYEHCLTGPRLGKPGYDDHCHRSHVHISLSWNGARGRTTFWTGAVRPTNFGPCRAPHKTYAPAWSKPNYSPCP